MNRITSFEWFEHFKHGEMSVENHAHSRYLSFQSNKNIEKIKEDSHFTINKISEQTETCANKFWLKICKCDMLPPSSSLAYLYRIKKLFIRIWARTKDEVENDQNFFTKVITAGKSWCYGYDPATKQRPSHCMTSTLSLTKKSMRSEIEY